MIDIEALLGVKQSREGTPGVFTHILTPPDLTMQGVAVLLMSQDISNTLIVSKTFMDRWHRYEALAYPRPPRKLRKCAIRRIDARRQRERRRWRRRR